MRKGMPGLALLVQEHFKRDPFAGDVFVFRGRGGGRVPDRRLHRLWPLVCAGSQARAILEAACWAHARRSFFIFADLEETARRKAQGKTPVAVSPIALEVVRRIDQLFEIERRITGQSAEQRRLARQSLSRPLALALHAYLQEKALVFSRGHDLYKAIQYMLKRWTAFTLFLEDGRVCLSNNAAERALRGIALGRC